MNRSNLFKIFQQIITKYKLNTINILSTKSGLTQINKNNIININNYIDKIKIEDKSLVKNYKRIEYFSHDEYYIKKLNNDFLFNNLIKSKKSDKLYKIFKQMPKPINPHIHFSAIVPYNNILSIINNKLDSSYPQIYINITILNNIYRLKLGFENDEVNSSNSEPYDKNKHTKIIIKFMKNYDNIDYFDKINIIGEAFYNVVKYKKFYIEHYLPQIINQMNNHNIYYIETRLILGGVFDIVNKQKKYINYDKELDILYEYRDRIRIILAYSKCKNMNYIVKKNVRTMNDLPNAFNNNNAEMQGVGFSELT